MGRNINPIHSWTISPGSNESDSVISIGLQRRLVIICGISGDAGSSALSNRDGDIFPDLGVGLAMDHSLGKVIRFVT